MSDQAARRARVRAAWSPPPGPLPRGDQGDPDLVPKEGESLDMLSGELRIFQRRDGHRWSTDDLLCAWFAYQRAADRGLAPSRALDLGTGIGSVAMMIAWRLPDVRITAVEAQAISADLCARSLRYDGLDDRITLVRGDFREAELAERAFDLVTGSPPYFDESEGVVSDRPQRGPCRFETRGGVEDYVAAAAHALSDDGIVVLVHLHSARARIATAARAHGLSLATTLPFELREGRTPHLATFELRRGDAAEELRPPMVIRMRDGSRSEAFRNARAEMGFPP